MSEEIRRDWRRAIWSIVVAAVIAIGASYAQTYTMQRSMNEQMRILVREQQVIRTKVDLMQIKMERKVDRETLDNYLQRIDEKLDRITEKLIKTNTQ